MIVEESKRLAKPSKSIPNVVKYALYVSVAFFLSHYEARKLFVSFDGARFCFRSTKNIPFVIEHLVEGEGSLCFSNGTDKKSVISCP